MIQLKDDESPTAEHVKQDVTADEAPDNVKDLSANAAEQGQGITGYEGLASWQTVKKFKLNAAICFLAAISAATEGCQIRFVKLSVDPS